MLGAMPNHPAFFNPDPNAGLGYTALVQRWQYVLTNMVRDGAMTQAEANSLCSSARCPQAETAFSERSSSTSPAGNGWTGTTGYLMHMVEQELESTYHLSLAKIDTGGLRITTTFSPSMMQGAHQGGQHRKAARWAAAAGVAAAELRPLRGLAGEPEDGRHHRDLRRTRLHLQPEELQPAVLPLQHGRSTAPGRLVDEAVRARGRDQPGHGRPDQRAERHTRRCGSRRSRPRRTRPCFPRSSRPPWVPRPRSRLAGGSRRARQPWRPISVAVAAAQSSDPAFTDLTHRVGVTSIIRTAQAFGVGSNPFNLGNNDLQGLNALFGPKGTIHGSVQIALGQGDLTPIEQASTFATLMDDGVYHAPHVISKLSQLDARRPAAHPAQDRHARRHEPGGRGRRGLRPVLRQHQRHRPTPTLPGRAVR